MNMRSPAAWWLALSSRLWLCAACALSVAACTASSQQAGATAPDTPRAAEPESGEQSCSRDVECVLVDDCCGCAHGGLRMSVRADRLDAVTERSAPLCAERSCSDQPSQHRSCRATAARCVGGRCLPAL